MRYSRHTLRQLCHRHDQVHPPITCTPSEGEKQLVSLEIGIQVIYSLQCVTTSLVLPVLPLVFPTEPILAIFSVYTVCIIQLVVYTILQYDNFCIKLNKY